MTSVIGDRASLTEDGTTFGTRLSAYSCTRFVSFLFFSFFFFLLARCTREAKIRGAFTLYFHGDFIDARVLAPPFYNFVETRVTSLINIKPRFHWAANGHVPSRLFKESQFHARFFESRFLELFAPLGTHVDS